MTLTRDFEEDTLHVGRIKEGRIRNLVGCVHGTDLSDRYVMHTFFVDVMHLPIEHITHLNKGITRGIR